MKLQPIICMLSKDTYKTVNTYATVEEASDDTLTSAEDIYYSLAHGCAINGYVWNRQFVPKGVAKLTIAKQSNRVFSNKKAVVKYDKNGVELQVYESVSQATKLTGITNIDKAARGLLTFAGGFMWAYKDSNNEQK